MKKLARNDEIKWIILAFLIKRDSCVCSIEEAATWEENKWFIVFHMHTSMSCTHTNSFELIINWGSHNCITSTTLKSNSSHINIIFINAEAITPKHKKYYRKMYFLRVQLLTIFMFFVKFWMPSSFFILDFLVPRTDTAVLSLRVKSKLDRKNFECVLYAVAEKLNKFISLSLILKNLPCALFNSVYYAHKLTEIFVAEKNALIHTKTT